MASALESMLARLHGVRKSGSQFIARCPAHDDRSPSMWLAQGEKGVLFGCRASCSKDKILAELNLEWRDTFDDALSSPSPLLPKRVNRKSESSSRQLAREEIEDFDWPAKRALLLRRKGFQNTRCLFNDQGELVYYDRWINGLGWS